MAILNKSRPLSCRGFITGCSRMRKNSRGKPGSGLIPWGDVNNKRQQIVRKLQKELDCLMARIP
jgi:hypothetical protein